MGSAFQRNFVKRWQLDCLAVPSARISCPRAIAILVLAVGCGARTSIDLAASSTDAEVPADAFVDTGPDADACRTPGGVRICGGSHHCPWLDTRDCPANGCEPTGATSDTGVCFSDLADMGTRPCDYCQDGEVCAWRKQGLVCVPMDLCTALWSAGDLNGCRYSDKTSFDDSPLPTPSGPCPGGLGVRPGQNAVLCGGACGGCAASLPCVGRSPGRPFGVCANALAGFPATCQAAASNQCAPGASCAIFNVPQPDQSVADQYGMCMLLPECHDAEGVLPGGLSCD
jgi:hypothetical protein